MSNELSKKVNKTFIDAFGRTPLTARLDDIKNELFELLRYTDMENLKEEAGDSLASLIQLCNECGWDFEEVIGNTLKKIKKREAQYKAIGRKTKVAIYGGAFDPIHNGHIEVAKFVLNTSKTFDEVWLLPCNSHMYGKNLVAPKHRLEMCKLAAKIDGRIKVCDYEIKHKMGGPTYNLMNRIIQDKEYKDTHHFSVIIGMDNANSFHEWVDYQYLEKLVRFVVIPRKGITPDPKVDWYMKEPHIYLNSDSPIVECSSTFIRNHLRQGNHPLGNFGIDNLMSKDVLDYIHEHKLYLGTEQEIRVPRKLEKSEEF